MMATQRPFVYLLDENLPYHSVTSTLDRLGRSYHDSRVVAPSATDQVLTQLASENGWVILTQDRDFKVRANVRDMEELREFAPAIRLFSKHDQTLIAPILEGSLQKLESIIGFVEENNLPIRVIRVKDGQINVEVAIATLDSRNLSRAKTA